MHSSEDPDFANRTDHRSEDAKGKRSIRPAIIQKAKRQK